MFKKTLMALVPFMLASSLSAASVDDVYEWLGALEGDWSLSTEKQQQGSCYFPEDEIEDVEIGIAFKYIGRGTTIQEDLLPDTERQMVTMYHKSFDKLQLKATHFCIKLNQPAYLANLEESTPNKLIFECDPSVPICSSNDNYVYKIIHEISEDGESLKTSYLSKKNKKPIPSTICEFERE